MNRYVGNTLQIYGVEEMRLSGGRGTECRILSVRIQKDLNLPSLLTDVLMYQDCH